MILIRRCTSLRCCSICPRSGSTSYRHGCRINGSSVRRPELPACQTPHRLGSTCGWRIAHDLFESATAQSQDDLYNGFKNSHWWQAQWLRLPFVAPLLQAQIAKDVVLKRQEAWRLAFLDGGRGPLPTLIRPQPGT